MKRVKDISKAEEQMRKKLTLVDKVDKTIESICESIQSKDMVPGECADTVKALAALVEARAKLI